MSPTDQNQFKPRSVTVSGPAPQLEGQHAARCRQDVDVPVPAWHDVPPSPRWTALWPTTSRGPTTTTRTGLRSWASSPPGTWSGGSGGWIVACPWHSSWPRSAGQGQSLAASTRWTRLQRGTRCASRSGSPRTSDGARRGG